MSLKVRVYLNLKRKLVHLPLFRFDLTPRFSDLSMSTSTSTDADYAQNQQLPSPSFPVEDSRPTMPSAVNNGPPPNHHSTELLIEALRTPHEHHKSFENAQDAEGNTLSGNEGVLDEQNQVEQVTASADGNTNSTSYSSSQAISNSPPIVLRSLPTTESRYERTFDLFKARRRRVKNADILITNSAD